MVLYRVLVLLSKPLKSLNDFLKNGFWFHSVDRLVAIKQTLPFELSWLNANFESDFEFNDSTCLAIALEYHLVLNYF